MPTSKKKEVIEAVIVKVVAGEPFDYDPVRPPTRGVPVARSESSYLGPTTTTTTTTTSNKKNNQTKDTGGHLVRDTPYAKAKTVWAPDQVFCNICLPLSKTYSDVYCGVVVPNTAAAKQLGIAPPPTLYIRIGTVVETDNPGVPYGVVMGLLWYDRAKKLVLNIIGVDVSAEQREGQGGIKGMKWTNVMDDNFPPGAIRRVVGNVRDDEEQTKMFVRVLYTWNYMYIAEAFQRWEGLSLDERMGGWKEEIAGILAEGYKDESTNEKELEALKQAYLATDWPPFRQCPWTPDEFLKAYANADPSTKPPSKSSSTDDDEEDEEEKQEEEEEETAIPPSQQYNEPSTETALTTISTTTITTTKTKKRKYRKRHDIDDEDEQQQQEEEQQPNEEIVIEDDDDKKEGEEDYETKPKKTKKQKQSKKQPKQPKEEEEEEEQQQQQQQPQPPEEEEEQTRMKEEEETTKEKPTTTKRTRTTLTKREQIEQIAHHFHQSTTTDDNNSASATAAVTVGEIKALRTEITQLRSEVKQLIKHQQQNKKNKKATTTTTKKKPTKQEPHNDDEEDQEEEEQPLNQQIKDFQSLMMDNLSTMMTKIDKLTSFSSTTTTTAALSTLNLNLDDPDFFK